MVASLVGTLRERQKERQLTDTRFADLLGVSTELWRKVKSGDRQPSRRIIAGILREFPDLQDDVVNFWLSTVQHVPEFGTIDDDEATDDRESA